MNKYLIIWISDYIDCATAINVTFTIGGVEYPVHPVDWSYSSPTGGKFCIGALQAANGIGAGDL
jgi:hypothetical protein